MSCLQESQTQNDGFTCIKIARSQSTLWKWSRRSFSIRSNMLWIDWRSVCLRWHTAKFCCLSLHVVTHLLFIISNFLASGFRLCWTWCCRDFRIKSGIFWNTLKGTRIVTKSISLARELRIRDWLPATWNVLFRRTSLRWRNIIMIHELQNDFFMSLPGKERSGTWIEWWTVLPPLVLLLILANGLFVVAVSEVLPVVFPAASLSLAICSRESPEIW